MAKIKPEFDKRNVERIDSPSLDGHHEGWAKDIQETQGHVPNYPIIGAEHPVELRDRKSRRRR